VKATWDYRCAGWMSPWTATDRRAGQVHQTGARDLVSARAFVAALNTQPAAPAAAVTFTLAGGPQRARAGHQRYTKSFA
jgi:hypothetical protein